jgi:hypothetical protein
VNNIVIHPCAFIPQAKTFAACAHKDQEWLDNDLVNVGCAVDAVIVALVM